MTEPEQTVWMPGDAPPPPGTVLRTTPRELVIEWSPGWNERYPTAEPADQHWAARSEPAEVHPWATWITNWSPLHLVTGTPD